MRECPRKLVTRTSQVRVGEPRVKVETAQVIRRTWLMCHHLRIQNRGWRAYSSDDITGSDWIEMNDSKRSPRSQPSVKVGTFEKTGLRIILICERSGRVVVVVGDSRVGSGFTYRDCLFRQRVLSIKKASRELHLHEWWSQVIYTSFSTGIFPCFLFIGFQIFDSCYIFFQGKA